MSEGGVIGEEVRSEEEVVLVRSEGGVIGEE